MFARIPVGLTKLIGKAQLMIGKKQNTEKAWVAIGALFSAGGMLATLKLMTFILIPNEFGMLALLLTGANLFGATISSPVSQAAIRYYSIAEYENTKDVYKKSVQRLLLYAVMSIAIVAMLVFYLADKKIHVNSLALTGVLLLSIGSCYCSTYTGIINSARERKLAAIYQIIDPWAKLLAAAIAAMIYGPRAETVIIAMGIAQLLMAFAQRTSFLRITEQKFISKHTLIEVNLQSMLSYSGSFILWGIISWGYFSSDKWILANFHGPESVAMLAVAFQLGYYPITLLSGMLIQYVYPIAFALEDSMQQRVIDKKLRPENLYVFKITGAYLLFVLLVTFVFGLAHNFIVVLFSAPIYGPTSWLVPYFCLSAGIYSSAQILILVLKSKRAIRKILFINFTGCAIGIFANMILIRSLGIAGAAYASVIYSVAFLLLTAFLTYKLDKG